jgi:hypothetical protein
LHAKEIYVRLWDERCIGLVELIDANRKKKKLGKSWPLVGRTLIGRRTHCTFVAAVCTLRPARVPIILTTFDTIAIATISGVVQAAVVLKCD